MEALLDNQSLNNFATWFIIFIVYSMFGWAFEVLVGIVMNRKVSNRGFLIGPLCPIYGVGAVLVSLLLSDTENVFVIFAVATIGSAILEYATSYIMEKLFRVRWWDYRDMPFNLNGRICLHAALVFGVIGILIVRIINPSLFILIGNIEPPVRLVLAASLFLLFLVDLIVSLWLILGFRVTVGTAERDATDEISARVHEIIAGKGPLSQRLAKAFPDLEPKKKPAKKRNQKRKTTTHKKKRSKNKT